MPSKRNNVRKKTNDIKSLHKFHYPLLVRSLFKNPCCNLNSFLHLKMPGLPKPFVPC